MNWRAWFSRRPPVPLSRGRLVVYDVETTGLDVKADRPIAIGAVAVQESVLPLSDQFFQTLRQPRRSGGAAMLAHRLTDDVLAQAQPAAEGLGAFYDYCGAAPRFAYHAPFDDGIMQRALREQAGSLRWSPSLDLAEWILWLHPELGPRPPTLDRALDFARIGRQRLQRHDAAADALLSAQLLLWMLPKTLQRGVDDLRSLKYQLRIAGRLRHMRAP